MRIKISAIAFLALVAAFGPVACHGTPPDLSEDHRGGGDAQRD
jgi:hypothetical protein